MWKLSSALPQMTSFLDPKQHSYFAFCSWRCCPRQRLDSLNMTFEMLRDILVDGQIKVFSSIVSIQLTFGDQSAIEYLFPLSAPSVSPRLIPVSPNLASGLEFTKSIFTVSPLDRGKYFRYFTVGVSLGETRQWGSVPSGARCHQVYIKGPSFLHYFFWHHYHLLCFLLLLLSLSNQHV